MRIGIDVTSALTQGGGIGRYTRELVRSVAALDSRTDYRLFSAKPPATLPVANPLPQALNMTRKPAPLGEQWLYRLWYRLRWPVPVQWVTGRLDLFHSPDFVLPPVSGRIPTLLTVHDLSFVHYPHVYTPPLIKYLNSVVPWSVERATHVLADSAATQRDLMELWGVPESKITVLYSGVDMRFHPVGDAARLTAVRQRYGLGQRPYILTVGTVQPRKNYQMLIRAFAPIAQRQNHNLVIAGGKGWLYDDILAEVHTQGLVGRVLFTEFVDDADLPALYSGASLFTFPSLYEGFGLPLLEAMACGVPVISSDASCLPEVAGDAAVLLPPHDQGAWTEAMQSLLDNPVDCAQLVASGYAQAKRFTWERAGRRLLNVYRRLLA
ncbi:MAG: glycosyltransferase family 1 protein [Chloroflexi bacterium]|nr:glycosyltransferase family 1 protein [Chloroflexota bacterium]